MAREFRRFEKRLRTARGDLLRWSFSSRQGRKLALETLRSDVTAVTLDCGDHVMSFSPHELIGRRIYATGHFDRDRVEELLAILDGEKLLPEEGATVLDIGANIGTQTVYFCKSGRVSRVLAVEPDPRNLQLLRRNVADNGLDAMVSIAACAIGDFDGEGELHRSGGNHGQSSLIARTHDLEPVRIAVRPMQAVLDEAGIAAADVSLVWMDIEGAEPMACRSMTALLERKVPLMLEYSPEIYGPEESRAFIDFLSRHYDRCLYFDRAERREMRVAELSASARQADILLLP